MRQTVINTRFFSRINRPVKSACVALLAAFLITLENSAVSAQPVPLAAGALASNTKTAREIEYDVKAAFIYNFMKFIEWPKIKPADQSTKEDDTPRKMTIGILGTNPFGDAFKPILDKEVQGQKIHLIEIPGFGAFAENYRDKSDALDSYKIRYQTIIASCDVLFLCESENSCLKELIGLTTGHHILTVSDIPDFVKRDGVIGFVKDSNKIRFEINLNAAEKEKLKIRSQLLTLAKQVHEAKK